MGRLRWKIREIRRAWGRRGAGGHLSQWRKKTPLSSAMTSPLLGERGGPLSHLRDSSPARGAKGNIRRLASLVLTLMLVAQMVLVAMPATEVKAEADTMNPGELTYDIAGVGSFPNATGSGSSKYKSLIISFTKTTMARPDTEYIEVPNIDGFVKNDSLSSSVTTMITMPQGKTLGEVAEFLRGVKVYNCDKRPKDSPQNINISVSPDQEKYVTFFCEATGHYYQFVPFTGGVKSWTWALNETKKMSYLGLQGYLATVTSYEEDMFIYSASNERIGWMGGCSLALTTNSTDTLAAGNYDIVRADGVDPDGGMKFMKTVTNNTGIGYWYWACGPEAGKKFFSKGTSGATSYANERSIAKANPDTYTNYFNWDTGEPNCSGGEYCLTSLSFGYGQSTSNALPNLYGWNDLRDAAGSGRYCATGFFVEYGNLEKNVGENAIQSSLVFDIPAPKLTHLWVMCESEYTDPEDPTDDHAIADMFCFMEDPKCAYYGSYNMETKACDYNGDDCFQVALMIEDHNYDRNQIKPATVLNGETFTAMGNTIGQIYYANLNTKDAEGKIPEIAWTTTRPKDVGQYMAKVEITLKAQDGEDSKGTKISIPAMTQTLYRPFNIKLVDANYREVSLNNLAKTDLSLMKKVSGETTREGDVNADLTVYSFREGTEISLYKIADINWNDNNKDYDDPVWVEQVNGTNGWLTQFIITQQKYGQLAYATPLGLGKTTTNQQMVFYSDMLKQQMTADGSQEAQPNLFSEAGAGGNDKYTLANKISDNQGNAIQPLTQTSDPDSPTTVAAIATEEEGKYKAVFSDLEFGLYAIVSNWNNDDKFQPSVVAIYPDRNGPWDNYFIDLHFYATLKQLDANIEKYITVNDEDNIKNFDESNEETLITDQSVTIKKEDDIRFDLKVMMPDIYEQPFLDTYYYCTNESAKNRVSSYTQRVTPNGSYTIEIEDYLSKGFALKRENYNLPLANDIEIYVDEAMTKTLNDALDEAYGNNFNRPYYEVKQVTVPTGGFNQTTQKEQYERYNQGDTIFRITFDPQKVLKLTEMETAEGSGNYKLSINYVGGFQYLYIRYHAYMTSDFEVGTDNNINTAYVDYVADVSGRVGYKESHVYGYTYGIEIRKKDGNTMAPLADAMFQIFKKQDMTVEQYNADVPANMQFRYTLLDMEVPKADGTGTTTETWVFKRVESDNCYGLYGDWTFRTTGNPEGDSIKGLGEGTYLIRETNAPTGYNRMQDDMLITIYELDREVAELNFGGSYKYFADYSGNDQVVLVDRDQDESTPPVREMRTDVELVTDEDGYFDFDVLNYKGITLPATGGIGTLIFILSGLAVVAVAFIGVGCKRRKEATEVETFD